MWEGRDIGGVGAQIYEGGRGVETRLRGEVRGGGERKHIYMHAYYNTSTRD